MPDDSEEGADSDRPEEPRESSADHPDDSEVATAGGEDEKDPEPRESTEADGEADDDDAPASDAAPDTDPDAAEPDEPVALEPEPDPGEPDPFEPADRYADADESTDPGGLEKVDDDDRDVAEEPVYGPQRPPEEREPSSVPEPGVEHDEADSSDGAASEPVDPPLEPAEQDNPRERDDLPPAPDDDIPPAPDEGEEPPEAKTDGEGVVRDHNEGPAQEPTYPDPDDDIGGISTPPDDQEMPLADHIEEMVMRLAVVLLIGSAFTALGLLWATTAIDIIWTHVIPESELRPPHVYHPLELWLTRIKVAALLGIMAALPMVVYQTYLFMKPGLYPNERKYYLAAVPTSVILAGMGMVFSFLVILPILFRYFTFYSEGSAEIAYALGETFNLIITLTGFLAVVFQIPLFIILAVMMGVTTRRWLADKRLYFWAAFAGLAFMFTMDPTLMAPIFVAITMILLFEGTLLVLKWVGRE